MTTTDMPDAAVAGRIVDDRVVPPGGDWSGVVPAGKVLRIVDLEGRQAVDFLCYSAADPSERYNAADTMKFAKHDLRDDRPRPLLGAGAAPLHDRRRHLRPPRHDRRLLQRANRTACATTWRGRRTAGTTSSGRSSASGSAGRTSSPT